MVLIRFLHVLPGDYLHSRLFLLACLFNFQASPSLSPLYKEGADGKALERELQWYVTNVCKCPSPQIYINLRSTPTFMSKHKVTDHICYKC